VGDPIRLNDQYAMELLVQVRPSGRILDTFKMQHWCRDIKIRRNVLSLVWADLSDIMKFHLLFF
jgi:hypothetical protein